MSLIVFIWEHITLLLTFMADTLPCNENSNICQLLFFTYITVIVHTLKD
jgi:hypothetical protein